jgi:hypothetical protein
MKTIRNTEEVLNILKENIEVTDIIKDLVEHSNGRVVLEDNKEDGSINELTIYSDHFSKKQLDVLFDYCPYEPYISINGGQISVWLYIGY